MLDLYDVLFVPARESVPRAPARLRSPRTPTPHSSACELITARRASREYSSQAIAVERSGFAPSTKTTGRLTRYDDTVLGARGSKSVVSISFEC